MFDYLGQFTPEELELLKAQNGKYTIEDNILHFDNDLPDALIEKMTSLSFKFYAETVREPETRREGLLDPQGTAHKFLKLLGLTQEKTEETDNTRKIARVTFNDNSAQFLPTHKKYSGALLPIKNKVAYIAKYDKQLQFIFDENGDYRIDVSDEKTAYAELIKNKTIPAKCADTDLLMTLAAAVEAAYRSNYGYIITVYLPNFAQAMGVQFVTDGKDQNLYDLKTKLKDLEDIIGVLVEQQKIQFAFKIIEIDQEKRELTFASPYLYTIMDLLRKEPYTTTKKKNNQVLYSITGVSHLVSSKINKARNKVTAQVIYYLLAQVHGHGIRTDATRKPQKQFDDKRLVTKDIEYKDIIKHTPLLKEALKEAEPKRRNQILKRAIFGDDYNEKSSKHKKILLVEYLKEYTDAYNYWKDLEVIVEPVTMKTLDHKIRVTHHGLNGDFQDTLHIPSIDNDDDLFEES